MSLNIAQNGMVHRRDDGLVTIHRPAKNGKLGTEIEVPEALAEAHRLASGDVVEGVTEPFDEVQSVEAASAEWFEDNFEEYDEHDEPAAARGNFIPIELMAATAPMERLVSLTRINGLTLAEAEERPNARRKRSPSERGAPDRLLSLATGRNDLTGRVLDFAAPLGAGSAGYIAGAHGSGLTYTLRQAVAGVRANAPDVVVIVLLLRARSEEITDWRRRFPDVDVVVCPALQVGVMAAHRLRVADLALEVAQRQTELGRSVLLAVDSLTDLWGTMLEVEGADAQNAADQSGARHRIREWIQRAGNFSGEMPLGGSLGGALTILGTIWSRDIDPEAEEEGEVHPHLRLLEHIVHETSWRVPLADTLAERRLYPAIDAARCYSAWEDRLLPPETYERLLTARRALADLSTLARYNRLMDALDESKDSDTFLSKLIELS